MPATRSHSNQLFRLIVLSDHRVWQVNRAPKRTKPALILTRLIKRQMSTRPRPWESGLLLNGLECRAALGSCKLRRGCGAMRPLSPPIAEIVFSLLPPVRPSFAHRSEDLWFVPSTTPGTKRARSDASAKAKRRKLNRWLEAQPREAGASVLTGLTSSGPVRLPDATTWQPKALQT
eukprot:scaffold21824_cov28-Tisochrysis_lutea.AAC.4